MIGAPVTRYPLKPTTLTQAYWDAARDGRLVIQRCRRCDRSFFRPELACPHCLSRDWGWRDSAGRGSLYSFSVIHRAPTPAFTTPFVFAVIELDEDVTMFSNLIDIAESEIAIGMRVKVAFHRLDDGLCLPVFRPDPIAPESAS